MIGKNQPILKALTKKELQTQLELEYEFLYIYKGNWLEHFKMNKELAEMYGGTHWRAERMRKSMNEVKNMLDEQHNKVKEIEAKIKKMS